MFRNILVPTDGSDASVTGALRAVPLARRVAASITVVFVQALIVEGAQAARGIVNAAQSCGADLIVMGSHGRTGVARLVLGSEATKVLELSPVPVMVVKSAPAAGCRQHLDKLPPGLHGTRGGSKRTRNAQRSSSLRRNATATTTRASAQTAIGANADAGTPLRSQKAPLATVIATAPA